MKINPNNYRFDGDGKATNSKKIKSALVTIANLPGKPLYNEIHIFKNLTEVRDLLSKTFPKGTMVLLNRGDYHKTLTI